MNPLRSLLALLLAMPAIAGAERAVARLASGAAVTAFQSPSGEWGIRVRGSGMTSMSQPHPVVLEFYNDGWPVAPLRAGYRSIRSLPTASPDRRRSVDTAARSSPSKIPGWRPARC